MITIVPSASNSCSRVCMFSTYVWYPALELSPPQVMVSVRPNAATLLESIESIDVKTNVAEMKRVILNSCIFVDGRNRRRL